MNRPATIVISDWLANCQVGQSTPFEAAIALREALRQAGYVVVPEDQWKIPNPMTADLPNPNKRQQRGY